MSSFKLHQQVRDWKRKIQEKRKVIDKHQEQLAAMRAKGQAIEMALSLLGKSSKKKKPSATKKKKKPKKGTPKAKTKKPSASKD